MDYAIYGDRTHTVLRMTLTIERLDALCMIFGVGLVRFDAENASRPAYDIRVRASRHEPDPFYVNRCLKLVEDMFRSL